MDDVKDTYEYQIKLLRQRRRHNVLREQLHWLYAFGLHDIFDIYYIEYLDLKND